MTGGAEDSRRLCHNEKPNFPSWPKVFVSLCKKVRHLGCCSVPEATAGHTWGHIAGPTPTPWQKTRALPYLGGEEKGCQVKLRSELRSDTQGEGCRPRSSSRRGRPTPVLAKSFCTQHAGRSQYLRGWS